MCQSSIPRTEGSCKRGTYDLRNNVGRLHDSISCNTGTTQKVARAARMVICISIPLLMSCADVKVEQPTHVLPKATRIVVPAAVVHNSDLQPLNKKIAPTTSTNSLV